MKVAKKSGFKEMSAKGVKTERKQDFNQKLFRSGNSQGWRKELDSKILEKYAERAKLYGYKFN